MCLYVCVCVCVCVCEMVGGGMGGLDQKISVILKCCLQIPGFL